MGRQREILALTAADLVVISVVFSTCEAPAGIKSSTSPTTFLSKSTATSVQVTADWGLRRSTEYRRLMPLSDWIAKEIKVGEISGRE